MTGFRQQSLSEGILNGSRVSSRLVAIQLQCIYAAGWDDTNILYFKNEELVKPVLDLATKVGLFHLDYES